MAKIVTDPEEMEEMMDIHAAIGKAWCAKPGKVDWLNLECTLVAILSNDDTPEERIALAKEAIEAFTRRGQFNGQYR